MVIAVRFECAVEAGSRCVVDKTIRSVEGHGPLQGVHPRKGRAEGGGGRGPGLERRITGPHDGLGADLGAVRCNHNGRRCRTTGHPLQHLPPEPNVYWR